MKAKNKFNLKEENFGGSSSTNNQLKAKFPKLTDQELEDMRLQFKTFDMNQDNLIDYDELMQVLNDLGDTSDEEMRENYFAEVDEDGSGAIDFEEFIGLVYRLRYTSTPNEGQGQGIALIANLSGYDNLQTLAKLSLSEKMLNGLF